MPVWTSRELERQIAELKLGEHACMLYERDEEGLGALAAFLRDGLARGEYCMYVVEEQSFEQALLSLAETGLDADAAQARGGLALVSAREVYLPDESFDEDVPLAVWRRAEEQALAAGFAGLRVASEPPPLVGRAPNQRRWVEYEAHVNDFLAGSHMLVLCVYDLGRFAPHIPRAILQTHPTVVLGRRVCPNPYYEPLDLALSVEAEAERLDWMLGQLQRLRDREHEAQALYRAATAIGAELDQDARLERVLDAALELVQADGAEVVLADATGGQHETVAIRGQEVFAVGERWPSGTGLIGAVLASNRPLRVPDAPEDQRVGERERMRQAGIRGWIGVPLADQDGAFGALIVFSREADAFTDADERLLQALAGLAGAAIREARLRQQVQDELAERERAEQALGASERRLVEAQRIAHVGSWETDLADGRAIWSDELFRIFGLEPRAFEATRESILDRVHPEDRVRMLEIWEREHLESGPFESEYRIVRPDGAVRVVHEQGEVLADEAAGGVRAAGTAQDVTERRRAEEALRRREQEFRALVESAPDLISRFDRDLRHVYVNPASERALGLPASAILGRLAGEILMTPSMAAVWRLTLQQVLATGREQTIELTAQETGGERVFQVRVAPELGPDGAVEHVVAIERDVTERAHREREQAALYRELLEREDRLQALVRRALLAQQQEQRRIRGELELGQLTRREREVLRLLAQGLTTREIAARLMVGVPTVKGHTSAVLAKLGVSNRTQAAIRASELGLLHEDQS